MEYNNKLKEYINSLIDYYYSKYPFLNSEDINNQKEKAIEKYLNSNLTPEDIANKINQEFELKRQAYEYRKMHEEKVKVNTIAEEAQIVNTVDIIQEENNSELDTIIQDTSNDTVENKKIYQKDNKGFAAFLSIVITMLVITAMVLVTMISYTLIK